MSQNHPELFFLAGPQQGRRVKIRSDRFVVGRLDECDLVIEEQHVSRRQLKFELAPEGWLMENLSANGTLVNDKRYKGNKKLLLDTGDRLGMGLETEVLFIAPGDDVEAALTGATGRGRPDEPQQASRSGQESGQAPQQEPDESAAPAHQAPEEPATEPIRDQEQGESKGDDDEPQAGRKMRRYAIFLGIYLVALVGLVVFLSSRDKGPGKVDLPPKLSPDAIRQAIEARPELPQNSTAASQELADATRYYALRNNPGNLYRSIKHFKRAMAYSDTNLSFDDENRYHKALDELVPLVQEHYNEAWKAENSEHWLRAWNSLEKIKKAVPERSPRDPTYEQLMANVYRHSNFVDQKLASQKR